MTGLIYTCTHTTCAESVASLGKEIPNGHRKTCTKKTASIAERARRPTLHAFSTEVKNRPASGRPIIYHSREQMGPQCAKR